MADEKPDQPAPQHGDGDNVQTGGGDVVQGDKVEPAPEPSAPEKPVVDQRSIK